MFFLLYKYYMTRFIFSYNRRSYAGPLIKEKAIAIASKLDVVGFSGSEGWLQRFRRRNGIGVSGQRGPNKQRMYRVVSADTTDRWHNETLPRLLEAWRPRDIYTADETALFYALKPRNATADTANNERCSNGERANERLTFLLCANMDGSEKLPLLVIG